MAKVDKRLLLGTLTNARPDSEVCCRIHEILTDPSITKEKIVVWEFTCSYSIQRVLEILEEGLFPAEKPPVSKELPIKEKKTTHMSVRLSISELSQIAEALPDTNLKAKFKSLYINAAVQDEPTRQMFAAAAKYDSSSLITGFAASHHFHVESLSHKVAEDYLFSSISKIVRIKQEDDVREFVILALNYSPNFVFKVLTEQLIKQKPVYTKMVALLLASRSNLHLLRWLVTLVKDNSFTEGMDLTLPAYQNPCRDYLEALIDHFQVCG